MYKKVGKFSLIFLSIILQSILASADRSHDGWDIHFNGYLQLDTIFDTTRTYIEQLNNSPVAVAGTVAGDNGNTKMSARQSRMYLKLNMPDEAGWKTKGWLEWDFQGYDPNPQGPTGGAQSEQSFFISPTFRMRNAYVQTENGEGWTFLAGQQWSVFGYQPYFEMLNTSTNTPINVLNRTPQVKATKALSFGDSFKGQADLAIERPTQRDSTIPNLSGGVRMNWDAGRKSGFLHWVGTEFTYEPTSLALSGTLRQYETPNADGNTADKSSYMGGGAALSAIVPILTTDGTSMKNNLTFLGEYIIGNGIGDDYVGWSGGQGSFTTGSGTAPTNVASNALLPNLDAGIAGYDSTGQFQLIQTQEFTAELQYILPTETTMAVNVEYGRLKSSNNTNLFSAAGVNGGTYDYNEMYSVDFVYSFSSNIRMIAEYSRMSTHYGPGTFAGAGTYTTNNRYAVSTYFMF